MPAAKEGDSEKKVEIRKMYSHRRYFAEEANDKTSKSLLYQLPSLKFKPKFKPPMNHVKKGHCAGLFNLIATSVSITVSTKRNEVITDYQEIRAIMPYKHINKNPSSQLLFPSEMFCPGAKSNWLDDAS